MTAVVHFPGGDHAGPSHGPRVLPHNLEAEQALLGAIMVRPDLLDAVRGSVEAEDFFEPLHGRIFQQALHLVDVGRALSPISLRPSFENDPAMAEIGGVSYLARLAANAVSLISAPDYARAVKELSMRRQAIAAMEEGIDRLFDTTDAGASVAGLIEQTEDALASVNRGDRTRGGLVSIRKAVSDALRQIDDAYRSPDGITGTPMGVAALDSAMGGLHPGSLTILAGRPGMGKSAVAAAMARNAGRAGRAVAVFSLEMAGTEWALRWITDEAWQPRAGIAYSDLARGRTSAGAVHRAIEAASRLNDLPIWVDETPGLSVQQMRARLRGLKRRLERDGVPLGLVVVDHLGLAEGSDKRARAYERVSEITKALKTMAKEMEAPVVALCQLSRDVERRENKRPILADLRDSGSIEQDADNVIFVYREQYYVEQREPAKGTADHADWLQDLDACRGRLDLIIAKQRQGARPTIETDFDIAANALRDKGAMDAGEMGGLL